MWASSGLFQMGNSGAFDSVIMVKCGELNNGYCGVKKAYVPAIFCKQCGGVASLSDKAKSFTKAAVKHVASGLKTREKKEIRNIIAICQECEFYTGKRCRKCGCNMKKKIQWATTHCPMDKW